MGKINKYKQFIIPEFNIDGIEFNLVYQYIEKNEIDVMTDDLDGWCCRLCVNQNKGVYDSFIFSNWCSLNDMNDNNGDETYICDNCIFGAKYNYHPFNTTILKPNLPIKYLKRLVRHLSMKENKDFLK